MPLACDHLYPEALGGPTVGDNLWRACSRCNDFKGDRITGTDPETGDDASLFHPRT
jgi:5-methylcytosine-specific restriction endonuclease McrA